MKKTETVALYLEEFLSGKSDEVRTAFMNRPIEKQYFTIMAWKRRRDLMSAASNPTSVAAMIMLLKKVKKSLSSLETLSQKDSDKLRKFLDKIYTDIDNFDKIKKSQLIKELESEKERIARQTENIDRKIEELRKELDPIS